MVSLQGSLKASARAVHARMVRFALDDSRVPTMITAAVRRGALRDVTKCHISVQFVRAEPIDPWAGPARISSRRRFSAGVEALDARQLLSGGVAGGAVFVPAVPSLTATSAVASARLTKLESLRMSRAASRPTTVSSTLSSTGSASGKAHHPASVAVAVDRAGRRASIARPGRPSRCGRSADWSSRPRRDRSPPRIWASSRWQTRKMEPSSRRRSSI